MDAKAAYTQGSCSAQQDGMRELIVLAWAGALISATDPVATLSIFSSADVPPLLYNLVLVPACPSRVSLSIIAHAASYNPARSVVCFIQGHRMAHFAKAYSSFVFAVINLCSFFLCCLQSEFCWHSWQLPKIPNGCFNGISNAGAPELIICRCRGCALF